MINQLKLKGQKRIRHNEHRYIMLMSAFLNRTN